MSLRVLILTEIFSPVTETFIFDDAVALQRTATVKVACMSRQNEESRPFTPVEVINIDKGWLRKKWHNQLYKFNIALNFSYRPLKKRLSSILKLFKPQVIHLHFGIQALHFLDNLDFSGPIFITFHGYDATKLVKKSSIYRRRLKEVFSKKNVFPLATSASLFSFMRKFDIHSERSQVMYSGVRTDLFVRRNIRRNTGTKILTQIASFREKKGHYYLLYAFRQLLTKKPEFNLQLWLVGGGPLEAKLKYLVTELNLSKYIKFLGWARHEDIAFILDRTDIFVHPSITSKDGDMESTTVAILEAVAMELPIFATLHSGIPEIVEHGVNGLLAREKDISDYVNCLESLLSWNKLPENRQKIISDFDQQVHIDQLTLAYKRALEDCSLNN